MADGGKRNASKLKDVVADGIDGEGWQTAASNNPQVRHSSPSAPAQAASTQSSTQRPTGSRFSILSDDLDGSTRQGNNAAQARPSNAVPVADQAPPGKKRSGASASHRTPSTTAGRQNSTQQSDKAKVNTGQKAGSAAAQQAPANGSISSSWPAGAQSDSGSAAAAAASPRKPAAPPKDSLPDGAVRQKSQAQAIPDGAVRQKSQAQAKGKEAAAGSGSKHKKKHSQPHVFRSKGFKRSIFAAGMLGAGLAVLAMYILARLHQTGLLRLEQTEVLVPGMRMNVTLPMPTMDVTRAAQELSHLRDEITDLPSQLGAMLSTAIYAPNLKNKFDFFNVNLTEIITSLPAFNSSGLHPPDWGDWLPDWLGGDSSDQQGASATGAPNDQRPGKVLYDKGYRPKHPVVIIPGFVTSQLEVWQSNGCANNHFRQKMWGTFAMLQMALKSTSCWLSHISLDRVTGMDPPGIKLRAAQGLEAVDFFVQGYWVWGKLVEALGDLGYDPNTLQTAAYDWRLGIPLMEARDGWFTRTKYLIEALVSMSGTKVVLASHSYGENVARTLLQWADDHHPGWVEKHVHAHIAIAGPALGVPKAVSSVLSGETRDTAQLGALMSYVMDGLVPRESRAALFRSWGSSLAMYPVGGPKVWGNGTFAPDDTPEMRAAGRSYGAFITSAPLLPGRKEPPSLSMVAPPPPPMNRVPMNGTAGGAAAATERDTAAARNADNSDTCSNASSTDAGAAGMCSPNNSSSSITTTSADPNGSTGITGIAASIQSLLFGSTTAEEAASDLLDRSQIHRMDISDAIELTLAESGSLMRRHFQNFAARSIPTRQRDEESKKGGGLGISLDAARSSIFTAAADMLAAVTKERAEATATTDRTESEHVAQIPYFPNALVSPLPKSPNLHIYCFYGYGLATERAYHYIQPEGWPQPPQDAAKINAAKGSSQHSSSSNTDNDNNGTNGTGENRSGSSDAAPAGGAQGGGGGGTDSSDGSGSGSGSEGSTNGTKDSSAGLTEGIPLEVQGGHSWKINTAMHHAESNLASGIEQVEGDLTVPLLSLGGMCRGGWQTKRLNPAGVKVVTREYQHVAGKEFRGGPATGSHVDILGNEELLTDILRVVTGHGDEVQDRVTSRIDKIVEQIPWEDEDGWEFATTS